MKIETSTVTKLLISNLPRLDPITVFLEDYGHNRGKMVVECYGRSWSAYWGAMGTMLVNFIGNVVTVDYIANCMFKGQTEIYDPAGLENLLKREVLKRRFKRDISHEEAFVMMYNIETSDFDAPYHLNNAMMVDLIGDDWHVCLPQRVNPDYAYLTRIVEVAKKAIAQIYQGKPDEK